LGSKKLAADNQQLEMQMSPGSLLPTEWRAGVLLLSAWLLLSTSLAAAEPLHQQPRFRRPVKVVAASGPGGVLVANRQSGSVSLVQLDEQVVQNEVAVGKQLSDMVRVPGSTIVLVTDEQAHQLVMLDAESLQVLARIAVSPYPVTVIPDKSGRWCYVASLWSRQLSVIELNQKKPAKSRVIQVVDMPFAPRTQLLVREDQRLIVADSFAGRLAVLTTELPAAGTVAVDGIRTFPGHNIRGLGVSANGRMLLVSHQMLNELAHTVRNDVHWGLLMSNDLRWLKLDNVLTGGTDLYAGAHMHPLGEAGSATGDPASLVVAANGRVVVALAGVGEIAIGEEDDFSLRRTRVGRRPTAIWLNEKQDQVVIANTFDDSISVVQLDQHEETARISLGPKGELTDAMRGELLFFDASISHDSWMSCHSCHTNGHTNGMLNDNFSDKSFGAPKRVLSLLGVKDTAPFAWNAEAADFATQVRNSIETTMQSDLPATDKQINYLIAYLRSLEPPPSVVELRGRMDKQLVARGKQLFSSRQCASCHAPPTFTTPRIYDVGITDKEGNHEFNPPSLRGVGQRGPFLHDNSAGSLEDVFLLHRHPRDADWDEKSVKALVAYLKSL
jgi:DNA-binding beta-propeller fold protein YncE